MSRPDAYVVMGRPVAHSLSPRIHAEFARQTGENIRYSSMEIHGEFRTAALAFFAAEGKGANITLPFKQDACRFADTLTGRAQRAGAVNVLVNEGDGILGDNTDGVGFITDVRRNLGCTLANRKILLLGAGGAARGIIAPLLNESPATLVIASRNRDSAAKLCEHFVDERLAAVAMQDVNQDDNAAFDIVINATSASLDRQLPEVPASIFTDSALAYDMVYQPTPTVFLQWASAAGAAQLADGWGMLIEQAAESFDLWRGVRPDTRELLSDAYRQELLR